MHRKHPRAHLPDNHRTHATFAYITERIICILYSLLKPNEYVSMICVSGQYSIQDLDKVMYSLQRQYGKIAKVGGLVGHPDLLFVFDGDEIRKIFKKEELLPHRY